MSVPEQGYRPTEFNLREGLSKTLSYTHVHQMNSLLGSFMVPSHPYTRSFPSGSSHLIPQSAVTPGDLELGCPLRPSVTPRVESQGVSPLFRPCTHGDTDTLVTNSDDDSPYWVQLRSDGVQGHVSLSRVRLLVYMTAILHSHAPGPTPYYSRRSLQYTGFGRLVTERDPKNKELNVVSTHHGQDDQRPDLSNSTIDGLW